MVEWQLRSADSWLIAVYEVFSPNRLRNPTLNEFLYTDYAAWNQKCAG